MLTRETVFLGATRPPEFPPGRYGTHLYAFGLNFFITVEIFAGTQNPFALIMMLPIHAVCVAISRHDPNAFRLLAVFAMTRLMTLGNWMHWRASSVGPHRKRAY